MSAYIIPWDLPNRKVFTQQNCPKYTCNFSTEGDCAIKLCPNNDATCDTNCLTSISVSRYYKTDTTNPTYSYNLVVIGGPGI